MWGAITYFNERVLLTGNIFVILCFSFEFLWLCLDFMVPTCLRGTKENVKLSMCFAIFSLPAALI